MIVPQPSFDDVFGLGVAWPAAISLIALTDFIMRWGRSTENTVLQYGAFEWVFHRLDESRLAAGANR